MIRAFLAALVLMALVPLSYGAQQTVNVGTVSGDGTGDPGRTAFQKVNANFTELYTAYPLTMPAYTIVCNNTASVAAPIQCAFASAVSTGNMALTAGAYSPTAGVSLPSTNVFNTGFGVGVFNALTNVVGQQGNTAYGYQALLSGTTISQEDAFGKVALRDDVEGSFNTAIGSAALRCFTGTGPKTGNVAIGHGAMAGDDAACATIPGGYPGTGAGNTAVGAWSGQLITTGIFNVLVGDSAGVDLTTGSTNIAIGAYAGCAPTTLETTGQACAGVQQSVGIGYHALRFNQTNATIGIGYEALGANTTGSQNVALGFQALTAATADVASTAIGYDALLTENGSGLNTAVGANAGKLVLTGVSNTYLGANTGSTNSTAGNDTGVGQAALTLATGGANTAVGSHAGGSVTSGNANVFIGNQVASVTCTTCAGNILIGLDNTTDTAASNTTNTAQFRGSSPGVPFLSATAINGATPIVTLGGDFIVNNGTGEVRHGAANAAVPVAQVISTQGSRSGTDTDTAGANLTVQSGLGTGSATGSTITLQTPKAGSTGTTAETAVNGLVLGATAISVGNATSNPTVTFLGTGAISGTPVTSLFASPPAIGGTVAAAGSFTTIGATGLISPTSTVGVKGTVGADAPAAGSVGQVASIHCVVGTQAAAATSVTITIATPGVVTWSSHTFVPSSGLANYTCPINFTGTPPTGIAVGTNYYIIGSSVSGDTFQISDTPAHALAATNAVATSGVDGGTTAYIGNVAATSTIYAGAALSLVAGDWDCAEMAEYQELTTLTVSRWAHGINTASASAFGSIGTFIDNRIVSGAIGAFNQYQSGGWPVQENISATTTIYQNVSASFTAGTMNIGGFLRCRRMR